MDGHHTPYQNFPAAFKWPQKIMIVKLDFIVKIAINDELNTIRHAQQDIWVLIMMVEVRYVTSTAAASTVG